MRRVLPPVLNTVLRTERIRELSFRDSRRVISSICTGVTVLEGEMYHRTLPIVDPQLDPRQYEYRRGRGMEMAPTEMMDFAHRSLSEGAI